jgi:hypothetical protein
MRPPDPQEKRPQSGELFCSVARALCRVATANRPKIRFRRLIDHLVLLTHVPAPIQFYHSWKSRCAKLHRARGAARHRPEAKNFHLRAPPRRGARPHGQMISLSEWHFLAHSGPSCVVRIVSFYSGTVGWHAGARALPLLSAKKRPTTQPKPALWCQSDNNCAYAI